jgi:hypothetical protein
MEMESSEPTRHSSRLASMKASEKLAEAAAAVHGCGSTLSNETADLITALKRVVGSGSVRDTSRYAVAAREMFNATPTCVGGGWIVTVRCQRAARC